MGKSHNPRLSLNEIIGYPCYHTDMTMGFWPDRGKSGRIGPSGGPDRAGRARMLLTLDRRHRRGPAPLDVGGELGRGAPGNACSHAPGILRAPAGGRAGQRAWPSPLPAYLGAAEWPPAYRAEMHAGAVAFLVACRAARVARLVAAADVTVKACLNGEGAERAATVRARPCLLRH